MIRISSVALALLLAALPEAAQAKTFRENDRSDNNNCAYVHNWYLHATGRHAVYVTTGGVAYGEPITKGGRCGAGDGATLAAAKSYALGRCEAHRLKAGIKEKCLVVESR